jgi:hypothetical protein
MEIRFRKQKELQESLLRQIEEKKLKKQQEKIKRLKEEQMEDERIKKDRMMLEERRKMSHLKRLEKTFNNQNAPINSFDAVQVITIIF